LEAHHNEHLGTANRHQCWHCMHKFLHTNALRWSYRGPCRRRQVVCRPDI